MGTIVVTGFDTPSILAAQTAAGVGGTLEFPAGIYSVDGLTQTIGYQTWLFDYGAILLRSATSTVALLTIQAPGLKIRGGTFDNNWPVNTSTADLIDCGSNDLDVQDAAFQNCQNWGILISTAMLIAKRNTFKNIRWGNINWSHTLITAVTAPIIEDNLIDQSMIQNIDTGAIYVRVVNPNNYQLGINPKIYRNKIIQPSVQNSNIVGILPEGCQRGYICDNVIVGGGNGISLDNNQYMEVRGNAFQVCGTYAIEVGGNDSLIVDNKGSGLGPSMFGIFVNPVVTGSAVINNHFPIGFTNGGIVNQAGSGCYLANNW